MIVVECVNGMCRNDERSVTVIGETTCDKVPMRLIGTKAELQRAPHNHPGFDAG
jgi:hypothetical protein